MNITATTLLDPAPLVFLIAGEPSGDVLGAKLMAALKVKTKGKIRFAGIGGARMEAEGLQSLFPFHELAMMGFAEIIPQLPHLLGRIRQTVKEITALQPRCIVTIDSPGFNFRVAAALRAHKYAAHLRIVHYVAPTVWAYKPERAEKMKGLFDYLMVVLPFEPPYFERVGLPCSFVGHPIVEEWQGIKGDGAAFRAAFDIPPDAPILTLLAGSRRGEIKRHLPIFAQVVGRLRFTFPHLVTVVVTPPHLAVEMKEALTRLHWPLKVVLVHEDAMKRDAFAATTLALTKSGTVALELSLAQIPMIVTYQTSKLTAWLLRRMIRVKYVNLVNLLLDKPVIPELLQEECNANSLTQQVESFLSDPKRRILQVEEAQAALALLRGNATESPSEQAAAVVFQMMGNAL
jgi:lipid-A-disaccharide synthase